MQHPLNDSFCISWSTLKVESIVPNITKALEQSQQYIDAIVERLSDPSAINFENSFLALEDATRNSSQAWGMVGHLDSVNNSPELREAYNEMLPKVTSFYTQLPLNDKLWQVLQVAFKLPEVQNLRVLMLDCVMRQF